MFTHSFEKEIIRFIYETYTQSQKEAKKTSNKIIKVGIKFTKLIKVLNIKSGIYEKGPNKKIVILMESNLDEISSSDNLFQLDAIRLIQTIHFLYQLEKDNYIMFVTDSQAKIPNAADISSDTSCQDIQNDETFIQFVRNIYGSRIIPTTALISFAENGYKSEQQIQFRKTQLATWVSIGIAFIIGLASLVTSIIIGIATIVIGLGSSKIDDKQFDKLITTIENAKSNDSEINNSAEVKDSVSENAIMVISDSFGVHTINQYVQQQNIIINGKTQNEKQ